MIKRFIYIIFVLFYGLNSYGQDSLITDTIRAYQRFDPQQGQKMYNAGLSYFGQNELEQAWMAFEQASKITGLTDPTYNQALMDLMAGRTESALALLNSISQSSSGAEFHFLKGFCYYRLNMNLDSAEVEFSRSLSIDPGFKEAYYYRGLVRMKLDDPKGAQRDFLVYTDLDDTSAPVWYAIATLYSQSGQVEKALPAVERALRIDTLNAAYSFLYGEILKSSGQTGAAILVFRELAETESQRLESLYQLGLLNFTQGKFEDATRLFSDYLQQHGDDAAALCNLGVCHYKLGQFEQAEHQFSRAINIEPGQGSFYFNRAACREMLGNFEGACTDWQEAAQLGVEEARNIINTECK